MTTMPVLEGFVVTSGFGPRWGSMHYGTDFGREGGCGGYPVFAVRSGRVAAAGHASGFGQWVCVDHPAAAGGGYSVYGHVIPEVSAGQFVVEGQRIARINPDRLTNGGVAPHLHLEFHRYTWAPPGPDRLDPVVVLRGAGWPAQGGGTHRKNEEVVVSPDGVIFGVDVSEHQNGMSLVQAAREGVKFAVIRTSDGTYRDAVYRSHVDDGRNAGLVLAAYHYMRNPSEGTSIRQQVDASLAVMGENHRLPVWLDCETDAGLRPDHIREAKRLFEAAGVRVIGCYSYVPWWENSIAGGEPDSHEFGAFWVASYGANRRGTPAELYPGNTHPQWAYPVGNQLPAIWQFGSRALVAGSEVDVNAFRGSFAELDALFKGQNQREREESRMWEKLTEILNVLRDVQKQLRGGQLQGWPQLGKNLRGEDLTVVDAIAALRHDVATLTVVVHDIKKGLGR